MAVISMRRKSVASAILYLAIALTVCSLGLAGSASAQGGGELRFCLRSEPKTFDPLKVEDDASVSIRYLTGGVLLRLNRQTQALEPELAQSWKVSKDGRQITFKLRSGISFSDGTPFSAEDVAYTVQQLMDPALHSPTGDAFRSGPGNVETQNYFSHADLDYISRARRWTRPAVRSGRDSFGALPEKRNGGAGAIHGGRLQARRNRAAEAQSELLEDRRPGPQTAVSRFDPARHSAQPRCRDAALQARRDRPDQLARQRIFRQAGGNFSATRARCRPVARQRADVVQRGGQVSAAAIQEERGSARRLSGARSRRRSIATI